MVALAAIKGAAEFGAVYRCFQFIHDSWFHCIVSRLRHRASPAHACSAELSAVAKGHRIQSHECARTHRKDGIRSASMLSLASDLL
jgi:hypothetical protein